MNQGIAAFELEANDFLRTSVFGLVQIPHSQNKEPPQRVVLYFESSDLF